MMFDEIVFESKFQEQTGYQWKLFSDYSKKLSDLRVRRFNSIQGLFIEIAIRYVFSCEFAMDMLQSIFIYSQMLLRASKTISVYLTGTSESKTVAH